MLNDSVKRSGPNVTSNSVLAVVLGKAKELDVSKDIVDRNIKRANEKGQEAYIEKAYKVGRGIFGETDRYGTGIFGSNFGARWYSMHLTL